MEGNRVRILILGDGNFSFSSSLAHTLCRSRSSRGSPLAVAGSRLSATDSYFITATSFDGSAELAEKYPECSHNLRKLHQASSWSSSASASAAAGRMGAGTGASGGGPLMKICVAHDIDATQDLGSQLARELHTARDGDTLETGSNSDPDCDWGAGRGPFEFDYVIFNFPHLGVESEGRHRQLLGHILHR